MKTNVNFFYLTITIDLDLPQKGVPPRNVLKKMFPEKKLEPACLVPVSLSDFTSWLETMKEDYERRQANVGNILLNSTNSDEQTSNRKKRSTFVRPDEFCYTLVPSNERTYGINPKQQGNSLDAAILCECAGAPWTRVRKQIKYKYCYSENLVDPKNDEFKMLKLEIEKHVS